MLLRNAGASFTANSLVQHPQLTIEGPPPCDQSLLQLSLLCFQFVSIIPQSEHTFFLLLLKGIISAKSYFLPLPPGKILFIWNNKYCKAIILGLILYKVTKIKCNLNIFLRWEINNVKALRNFFNGRNLKVNISLY